MRHSFVGSPRRLVLVALTLLLALAGGLSAPAARAAGMTYNVLAGGFDEEAHLDVLLFLPGTIRIHPGDTVAWQWRGFHTVTFLGDTPRPSTFVKQGERYIVNPQAFFPSTQGGGTPSYEGGFLNSGAPQGDETTPPAPFSVTFPRQGTFNYVCIIHPWMDGRVVVEPATATVPTQAEVDQQAATQLSQALERGRAAVAAANKPTREAGPGGTSRWRINMGINAGGVEALAFLPPKVTIAAGDTVSFDWSRGDPHNAYFPAGQRPPEFIVPEPQQNGPPTLLVSPQVLARSQPSGGSYDGSAPLNTGLFAPREDGLPDIGTSYSVTFTKPGTYPYLCSVHGGVDPAGKLVGMVGEITVVARQAQPLPNTGVESKPLTFAETGYGLDGDFLRYWQANGGLEVFGMPLSSASQANGRVSQVLERARFELHAENAAPYNVLLSRVGVEALAQQGRDWQSFAKATPDAAHYFAETGHAIAPEFFDYWSKHGLEFGDAGVTFRESLALFGYPISGAQLETNSSGHRVLTQWFERARFELHPGNPAAHRVLLGRLGAEVYHGGRGR